jgi:hypothetical protein
MPIHKAGRHSEMAKRLRHLRQSLSEDNIARWAQRVGIAYTRWHNFESGYPISIEAAIQLCRRINGLTLDYIYFGKPDGLPMHLHQRLFPSNAQDDR